MVGPALCIGAGPLTVFAIGTIWLVAEWGEMPAASGARWLLWVQGRTNSRVLGIPRQKGRTDGIMKTAGDNSGQELVLVGKKCSPSHSRLSHMYRQPPRMLYTCMWSNQLGWQGREGAWLPGVPTRHTLCPQSSHTLGHDQMERRIKGGGSNGKGSGSPFGAGHRACACLGLGSGVWVRVSVLRPQ